MTYQTEFPDFDPATVPPIPEGWEDCSLAANGCLSWQAGAYIVNVEYADPAMRLKRGSWGDRFYVLEDTVSADAVFSSNDWDAVLAFIANKQKPLYQQAFPEFVLDVAIPEGWQDTSWRNDTCPSWQKEMADRTTLKVFVDYADPARREVKGLRRFHVQEIDEDDDIGECFSTDYWKRVLEYFGDTESQKRRDEIARIGRG
jgi:hypothetical protein